MIPLLLTLALQAGPAPAGADPRAPALGAAADAAAFCAYAVAAGDSEALPLLFPDVVGSVGWMHGTDELPGHGLADTLYPIARVGLRYDLAQVVRGVALRRLARAECDRYRLEATLRSFVDRAVPAAARRALEARVAVLEAALPRLLERLQASRRAVDAGGATVAELNALELRVDGLRALLAESRRARAALPEAAPASPAAGVEAMQELLAQRHAIEQRVVELEGAARQSRSWELSVRGGYERVFAPNDNRVPLFGVVTLSVNPALPLQRAADARAERARAEWLGADPGGVDRALAEAQRQLAAAAELDRGRIEELAALAAELEGRLRGVDGMKSERIERYRDGVWLDLTLAQAELAYLRAHLEEVTALGGASSPSPAPATRP